jgi:hypothetical protein
MQTIPAGVPLIDPTCAKTAKIDNRNPEMAV